MPSIFLTHVYDNKEDCVDANLEFTLLNQPDRLAPPDNLRFSHTFKDGKNIIGYTVFFRSENFKKFLYVKDVCFTIRCDISFLRSKTIDWPFVDVPASKLDWYLGNLLGCTVGADVTFVVDGETFIAHWYVLTARSPVFKARLLGTLCDEV